MRLRARLSILAGVSIAMASGVLALAPQVAIASGPDPVNTIYVADGTGNRIDVFAAGANGNVAPIRTISGPLTGLDLPTDVKVDSAGDLYASNIGGSSITEYGPGASGNVAPIRTISGSNTGLNQNDDMSLAPDGTVYVGNFAGNFPVEVFAPGANGNVAPLRVIAGSLTGLSLVDGVGVDATGTLYADNTVGNAIEVFAPGANGNVAPVRTISGSLTGLGPFVDGIVVGFSGELFVTNEFSIEVFAAGANGNVPPLRAIAGSTTGIGGLDDLGVDAAGTVYVTDFGNASVHVYAPGANGNVAPQATIAGSSTTFVEPEGIDVATAPAPSLTTNASPTIALGASTHDTATLSGGTSPTGSLIFKLFGPSDPTCSAAPAYTSPLSTVTGNGTYTSPSFTPTAVGTYSWVVLYSGDTNNASVSTACGDPNETVSVTNVDQAITATGMAINSTEGQLFTGPVATFTDPDTNAVATDYSATIVWGDGNSTAGTIAGSGGNFTVSGANTYAEEGPYNVTVTITDVDTATNTAVANSKATVLDAALTATPACPATSVINSFTGTTATFTDAASPFGTLSDFSATINWGDGTTTAGTVTGADGGPYTVSGSHTYATTGNFLITTTINDLGGSTVTTSCNTLGFAFAPGGGSFVIGDKNAAIGNSVTFWGAHWAKTNSLSGGSAPSSFKGFAENPTAPSCLAGWSTDTGSSTPPPAGPLPTFMGVIVTSSADQSGSTISGNNVEIVIVQTNPGYAPDSGHAGTGTVVAVVC